ncbi:MULTISPECIES: DUF2281 domain-containing protein [unclassified Nostoc]|uniref:DUF2281 domain-containing protein n=1 Tax=unclassified Nostoc TaxID=2593658 RepID=UPI0028C40735|nr:MULTISPECIES: DUF2281 domain-containing protein [unclassified Nostoc]
MEKQKSIFEIIQSLTPQQQEEVLNFIEFLQFKSQKNDFDKKGQTEQKSPEKLGWMPGFFEEVIGGWVGEPLERPEQGEYETREALF